ncbi:MAG: hypothetical protein NTW87_06445 [Planctomycetota bacterium]|nr:hypothetical protein [Planctomycetota bacterium]
MAQEEDRLSAFPDVSPAGGTPALQVSGRWRGACLFLVSIVLLLQCWKAPFLTFDDALHVTGNRQVTGELTLARIFLPQSASTYFPVTVLSYRLDRALFSGWMPQVLGSWAPGVRLHTWLYHAAATLLVWQVLLALGVGSGRALFAAFVFALHPTACETVCWVSERKNALAGFFGLASIWCSLRFAGSGRLGLGDAAQPGAGRWRPAVLLFAPLALMSAFVVWANIVGHEKTLVPPPGGSVFTALLTDVEILSRYLLNLAAPVRLSFVYYVEPIVSLADARLWAYGCALALVVAASLVLAENKPRAVLGWGWFLLALSPHLNVIAILQIMQDRYLYLALPGFLLVVAEVVAGLQARLRSRGAPALQVAAIAYILFLGGLASYRGAVFVNAYRLFSDAVEKQPPAAHARFGLSLAYAQIRMLLSRNPGADPRTLEEFRRRQGEQLRAFVDKCPDRFRQPNFSDMALDAGNCCRDDNDLGEAERYYHISAAGAPGIQTHPHTLSEALSNLADLKLRADQAEEAYALACDAVKAAPHVLDSRVMRARAAMALARKKLQDMRVDECARLWEQARADLEMVPADHQLYRQAQELLKQASPKR